MPKTRPLAIVSLLLAAACGGSEPIVPPVTVVSVTVSPGTATLNSPGETVQFSATVRGSDGSTMSSTSVSWTSSDALVASISSGGLATAVAAGTVAITATAGGKAGSSVVTVEIIVTDVIVSPSAATLSALGETVQFSAAILGSDGSTMSSESVTWASSDESVASISSSGLATAVAAGTATITATASGVVGSAAVTVEIPGEVTVASVTVSPSSATLGAPGETVQFSAIVLGSDGSTMSSEPVTWTSSDASVASISSSGLATAVTAGTATITATAGGKSGFAVVTVEEQSQCGTVSIAPGDFASYDASTCILLPSGQNGDRYRVAIYRPTAVENAADVTTASLTVTGIGVSLSPPVPVPARVSVIRPAIRGLSVPALERSMRIAAATERAHVAMRRQEVQLVADLGADALLPSRRSGPLRSIQRADSPAKIQIDPRTPSTCSAGAAETVTAILVDENDDLAIYQDSTQNASTPVTAGQVNRMLSYYSAYAKQMIDDYFGAPSDLDGNGKIIVFVTPTITGDLAAQVWSGDFFPQSLCSSSNEMELVYFSNSLIQAMDKIDNPSYQALETLAHEAKHVVSLYHRIQATERMGSPQFHPSWIEEGTAEIAGGMSSRIAWAAVGGPAVGAEVTGDHLRPSGGGVQISPENYGILLRMARTIWHLSSQPNSIVVNPNGADEGHSIYGTGWNFHRWLGDAYGNAATALADAATFKEQNDSMTAGGLAGLTHVTGKTYEQLLEEYFIAVMLHGTGAPQPTRAITTYDFITATDILVPESQPAGAYPWPVTEQATQPAQPAVSTPVSFSTATYAGPIGPSGVRIHDFLSNGTGTGAQIEVSATPPAKIVVVRIR